MLTTGRNRILVLVLFFISGITGLVYEVAWTRMFVTVFGSTTYAVSTVLAAFMAGLALGSIVLGKVGDRFERPVLAYGLLQILIGIYALFVPLIIGSLVGVYSSVFGAFGQQPLPVAILRFLLSFAVILVPTTLMGGTFPILSKFAGREFAKVGKDIGALYAINTFGAVIGSFVTGFLLLELIGVSASVYLAAALSLSIGIIAAWAGRSPEARVVYDAVKTTPKRWIIPRYVAFITLLAIGISGGAALAYEVVYAKVLLFSLGATAHAFSLMLTTFLVGLALGSFVASRLADRWRRPTEIFGVVEILIGIAAFASIYFLSRLDVTHDSLAIRDAGGDLFRLRGAGFLQAAIIMVIPAFLMGSAFPIVTRIYTRQNKVSLSVGKIYFFNTIGAVAGSLIAGFVLVPLLGSARSIALLASFNIAVGILLFSCTASRRIWAGASAGALIVLIVVTSLIRPSVFARTFNIKERGSSLLYFKEGVSGTVTVHRYPDYDLLAIDGVNVAGTSDMLRVTQKLQGHLPILLADDRQRVAHIGFGSGETLRILTLHGAGIVDGIEICKDVIHVARRFFSALNQLVFDRPNVNVIIMDGKNYVLLTDKEYDIIMTDSIYPGTGGASALYTYDHFKAVRDKLKTGGVASCWLPLDLSPEDLRIALKAFYDAFPDMSVWYCYMTFSQHALLVGRKDAPVKLDLTNFERAFEDSVIRTDLQSILIDDTFTLISCFFADGGAVSRFCGNAPRHSDDHPVLEFGLARHGSSKPYLSRNLESLLALRPNPLRYVSGVTEVGMDSAYVADETMRAFLISSNIIGGHIHNALGETGRARAQYQKVLSLDPENRIAKHAVETLDAAITSLERAAQAGRGGYSVAYNLGVRYLAEGRFEEALPELERALKLRPDLPDPHVTMGELCMRWGKPEEAVKHFLDAREILPGDDGILVRLGMSYEALGRMQEAKEVYLEAADINPNDYELRVGLGRIYMSEGKTLEARGEFEGAMNLVPERPHALYYLGLSYAAERDWQPAREYFRQCVTGSPAFHPAHFQLGNVLFELGDREGAIRAWEMTLALNPGHKAAQQRLQELKK